MIAKGKRARPAITTILVTTEALVMGSEAASVAKIGR
jgi:hypothetical protein